MLRTSTANRTKDIKFSNKHVVSVNCYLMTALIALETEGLTVDHNGVTNNANLVVYIGSKGEGTLLSGSAWK